MDYGRLFRLVERMPIDRAESVFVTLGLGSADDFNDTHEYFGSTDIVERIADKLADDVDSFARLEEEVVSLVTGKPVDRD